MNNHSEFKKIIDSSHGDSIHIWITTLPDHDQQEWNRVHELHESIVDLAVANGEAVRVKDIKQIFWKNDEIHLKYTKQMVDLDIYLNFWKRYTDSLK
jgi:hypothetical protein